MPETREPQPLPGREPLRRDALERALVRPGGLWRSVEVYPELASTNTELAARARQGGGDATVVVTDHQTSGRGRRDRGFQTPARAALTFSVLVRPEVPPARLGWLPLLMGVAAVDAVRETAGCAAGVKWPNDVLATGGADGTQRKLAGILSEAVTSQSGIAVVVGMGLNVTQTRHELPTPTATSLAVEGAALPEREPLLRAVLDGFAADYTDWAAAGGDAVASGLAQRYRERCDTVGRRVRVELPNGRVVTGSATGVDAYGHLLVRTPSGEEALSAGDVVHVRPDTDG